MALKRSQLAELVCEVAGEGVARMVDPDDGWPSRAEVLIDGSWRKVALFVGPVGLSHRQRDNIERRFQNPGQNRPMLCPDEHFPMFLGVWREDSMVTFDHTVLVSADVSGRAQNTTRFSVFPKITELQKASEVGWAESITESNERLTYLRPEFLGIAAHIAMEDIAISADAIVLAAEAAGIAGGIGDAAATERVRRLAAILVRDAKFARNVLKAYNGRCALCGLGSGLVEAAHIYPASAPASPDVVSNGIALCRNHHKAFDLCSIYIDPGTHAVTFHPDMVLQATTDRATSVFIAGTRGNLLPVVDGPSPSGQMFERRYALLESQYSWILGSLFPFGG